MAYKILKIGNGPGSNLCHTWLNVFYSSRADAVALANSEARYGIFETACVFDTESGKCVHVAGDRNLAERFGCFRR